MRLLPYRTEKVVPEDQLQVETVETVDLLESPESETAVLHLLAQEIRDREDSHLQQEEAEDLAQGQTEELRRPEAIRLRMTAEMEVLL